LRCSSPVVKNHKNVDFRIYPSSRATLAPSIAEFSVEGELPAIPNSPERREYHINYEIWMLEETNIKRHDDEPIKNALIESFCVHARNLFEFFGEEAPKYTQNYQPFSHVTKRKRKGILSKLNVHVTHVKFQGRVINHAAKINDRDRAEMLNIFSDEIKEFKTHLRPEYSDVEIRDLPRVTIDPVGSDFFPSLPLSNSTTSSVIVGPSTFFWPPRKS
jgi:hypothetical protein